MSAYNLYPYIQVIMTIQTYLIRSLHPYNRWSTNIRIPSQQLYKHRSRMGDCRTL